MPYGAISEVILAKQKILPLLTIHQVKNQLKKTGTTACTAAGGAAAATPSITTTTTISTLTQECEYGTHFPPSSLPMTSNTIMHSSFEVQEDKEDEEQECKKQLTEKEGTLEREVVE